jgi:hypothetical protein
VSVLGAYGAPDNAAGLAFDKTGRLYLASQGGRVYEISKTDGGIIRTVALVGCATGIATDPISGDLFVSNPCGGATVRVTTAGVIVDSSYGPSVDGITFGPDGTLWGAGCCGNGNIYKIAGTNAPVPGSFTVVANVTVGDGISVAAASGGSGPPFIFVNRNDGIITKVDLSGPSPVYSNIVTGGSRGDFSTVGFDGCLYASQTDRVLKITNADGSCSLAPVTPDDVTSLTHLAPASEDFNDTVHVSATLTNVSLGAPLAGKTVAFTLGSGSCSAVTSAAGVATCSITIADPAGPATLTAHYDHEPTLAPATSTLPFTINLEETTLTYTGVSGAIQNGSTVTLSGVLKEDGVTAIAGASVSFTLGLQSCIGTTDAGGAASCAVVVSQPSGPAPISASFAGDHYYRPAHDSAGATISAASNLVYTGATTSDYNDPATLSAKLTSLLTGLPIASATVTLTLGTQSCVDTTNASGVASCSITPNVMAGSYPVTASFAGDGSFDPSSDSASFAVTVEQTAIVYTGSTATVVDGNSLVLSATLTEDGVTPISGRVVSLSIGSGPSTQFCVDTTNLAGAASCSIAAVHQPVGPTLLSADFIGDAFYLPASDTASLKVVHRTAIAYTSDTTGDYNDPATLSAKLIDAATGLALGGFPVDLAAGSQFCSGPTNAGGVASCPIIVNQPAAAYAASASFAGTPLYLASSDSATFVVTHEQTMTVYTGATAPVLNGTSLLLSATLKEDGVSAIAGRSVTLKIGTGGSAQSCVDTTNLAGAASCSILVSQAAGIQLLSATFAGDAFYLASSDSSAVRVYTAQSVKQDALATLDALAGSPCKVGKDDENDCHNRFASADRKVRKSLTSAWWVDGNHLTLNGCGVFDNEKAAASQLRELLRSKKLTAAEKAVIQAIIDQLVQADQILAQTAVNEATAAGGNAKKLAAANKALAKAAALVAAGKPDEAINQYRIAWEKAQESLGRKVCGDDGHEDEDGHDDGHHDHSGDGDH